MGVPCQALDGVDLGTVGLYGENGARLRAPTVDEDCARAALAGVAADVRARQEELLSQEVHEEHAWLHSRLVHFAVDRDRDPGHVSLLSDEAHRLTRWPLQNKEQFAFQML